MDTLVVVGTWTAWLYSLWVALAGQGGTYFESAAMITVIVLLGRLIEATGRRSAAAALAGLEAGSQSEAWRLPSEDAGFDDAERVAADSLAPGDTIAVRAGERIPADGVILRGASAIDQSRLTGEAVPAERGPGGEAFAGTINLTGLLVVAVSRAGSDTLAGRISAIVEDAAFAKAHTQRLADAVAGVFVPVVFAIAAATLLITGVAGPGWDVAVSRAVTVLVVACPCALGLATPLAVANAVAAANRRGIVVRGGVVLERAGEIAVVALDKTGTLTYGRLSVAATVPASLPPGGAARMLGLAAALEAGNPHPAARAIAEAAEGSHAASDTAASRAVPRPGLGIEGTVDGVRVLVGSERLLRAESLEIPPPVAEEARIYAERGQTVVWVAEGERVLGGLALSDAARPEAADAIAAIRARGVRTVMVSGDAQANSAAVGAELGIDEVRAEVLPNDKEQAVRELAQQYGPVAFVGDGLNDAPALAAADLAVAMGGGSDVALDASDIVLLGQAVAGPGATGGTGEAADASTRPLAALPYLLALAKGSRRIIGQNLAWAFTYNIVAIPLAVAGLLSPVAAAAAMALSSLAVVANSLRVRALR
jgi:heavy metal translocating P-type ATPase